MTRSPEILLLASGRSARLVDGTEREEPFPARIQVRPRADRSLDVGLAEAPEPGALGFDLARDLAELAQFRDFEALLEPWVALLAAGPQPLPPPRPLILVLPFAAFPQAARRLRAWADRRLHRPLLLVSEPLALLAANLEALSGAEGTLWLPAGRRELGVKLRHQAQVIAFRPAASPGEDPLARGAARLGPWLLGAAAPMALRLSLRPTLALLDADARRPLATFALPAPDRPLLRSLRLDPHPGGSAELRATLGPGRGDSVALATLPVFRPSRLELEVHGGRGHVRVYEAGPARLTADVDFTLPELVA